jgi:hypothetical protein
VFCLDAQSHQYNSSGWKYIIAYVVKDNEMKAAVVAKLHYNWRNPWVLDLDPSMHMVVLIEPCFKLANIGIIFADQKLTPTMLEELGIQSSTCTILCGDFYQISWMNSDPIISIPHHDSIQNTRRMGWQLLVCIGFANKQPVSPHLWEVHSITFIPTQRSTRDISLKELKGIFKWTNNYYLTT